jgi:hypothetical protein
MLQSQLSDAIASARTLATLDNAARLTWRGHSEGLIDDSMAEYLSAAIEARRVGLKGKAQPSAARRPLSRPRPCRSPERAKSIARRRSLAASGAVPGTIAANFTTGEIAALTVIARQCQRVRSCDWFMDRIAAVAGVSRTTVRNALRQAQALGLISIQERRKTAWRSDSNVLRIVSAEWLVWLGVGSGCKKAESTSTDLYNARTLNSGRVEMFSVCSSHYLSNMIGSGHENPELTAGTNLSR